MLFLSYVFSELLPFTVFITSPKHRPLVLAPCGSAGVGTGLGRPGVEEIRRFAGTFRSGVGLFLHGDVFFFVFALLYAWSRVLESIRFTCESLQEVMIIQT